MPATMEPNVARAKAKPKGEPDPSNRKPLVIQVRAGDEWKAWVERVAEKDGRSLAALVDRAIMVYAKQIGIIEEPPKR